MHVHAQSRKEKLGREPSNGSTRSQKVTHKPIVVETPAFQVRD